MARSPACHSHTANTATSTTKPTSRPITVLLFHGLVCPPYCVAKAYEMRAPKISVTPIKSACKNFSFHVVMIGLASGGVRKKKRTMRTVICYELVNSSPLITQYMGKKGRGCESVGIKLTAPTYISLARPQLQFPSSLPKIVDIPAN